MLHHALQQLTMQRRRTLQWLLVYALLESVGHMRYSSQLVRDLSRDTSSSLTMTVATYVLGLTM
jgi:hypothetical protein